MKKRTIVITVFLVVLISVGVCIWYFTRPAGKKRVTEALAPTLVKLRCDITDIESDHIKLKAYATLQNQAPIALHLDSLYHTFYLEGQEVAYSIHSHAIDLDAKDTSTLTIPVILKQDLIASILKKIRARGQDSVHYELKSCLYGSTLAPKGTCIKTDTRLPLPIIPELGFQGLKLKRLGLSSTKLKAQVWMYHEYGTDIKLNQLQYELEFAGQNPVEGSMPGTLNIRAQDTTHFEVPIELNIKELAKSLVTLLQKGDETPYKLKVRANILSDSKLLNGSKINLNVSGTKADLEKLVKEVQR